MCFGMGKAKAPDCLTLSWARVAHSWTKASAAATRVVARVTGPVRAARAKKKPDKAVLFPTIDDGVKGMAFIEAVLKSSAKGGKWTKLGA